MVHKLDDKYALDCAAQSWERLADRSEHDLELEDWAHRQAAANAKPSP
jgi:hypothetical protein